MQTSSYETKYLTITDYFLHCITSDCKIFIQHRCQPLTFLAISGDEIFSVNGRSVAGLTHSEAIGIFKETKVGAIQVTIGRRETTKKTVTMDDDVQC